jgi:very-short-patch-repair endonuclease
LSKNPRNCLEDISDDLAQSIVAFYSEPNSKAATAKHFGLTMHTMTRFLKETGIAREKYSPERNKLVSKGIKKMLQENPEIVEARVKLHTGSKRSTESRKRMQESAWKRMANQTDRFVSKAELQFGEFLRNKLGLHVQHQYRSGLKPFDFLVDGRVLVEFDGPHHYDPNYYMCQSGQVNFEEQQKRDAKREQIAKQLGMKLVVVRQRELDKKMRLKGDALHKFMGDLGYEAA